MSHRHVPRLIAAVLLLGSPAALAQAGTAETPPESSAAPAGFDTKVYGFIDAHLEKVAATPAGVDGSGDTVMASNPAEWDIPNLVVMVQGNYAAKFRYFLNLQAPGAGSVTDDEGLVVRNAWVEAPLYGDWLTMRFGKTYRRFGLYNELLDAVPTYNAIEPPELFDKDHLLLTRTTNLMFHGKVGSGENFLAYALQTGADEREKDQVPLGVDVRFSRAGLFTVGSSFYTTGGKAVPSRAVGDGSPRGGVINWMAQDEYMAYGAFAQAYVAGLTIEVEGWQATHDGVRDPASIVALDQAGALNARQFERFFGDACAPGACIESDVITEAKYEVTTGYVGLAYDLFFAKTGGITPYGRLDFYDNPETIAEKDFGGDDEAGLADDGQFIKSTVGVIWRPNPAVAFKVDGSTHTQQFNGESITYPEIRISLSYLWEL